LIRLLKETALSRRGQFALEGEEPEKRLDLWGILETIGLTTIIKLTIEAVDVADKVIDVIIKARKGLIVPLEIICPDGKTIIKIESRETDVEQKLKSMKEVCS
jgi:hypothetical protein